MKPYRMVDLSWPTPEQVVDEEYHVPTGDTVYTFHLTDEQTELLSRGVVDERLASRAYRMLQWKRDRHRAQKRQEAR